MLICTFILTVGMVSIAGLLAVTLQAQQGARESARSMRLAQTKMDELMKLNFTAAAVSVGGDLDASVANHKKHRSPASPCAGLWPQGRPTTRASSPCVLRTCAHSSSGGPT